LEERGIGYLADPYELRLDTGEWLRVRITEVSTTGITVKKDDCGAIDSPQVMYSLPFPITDQLRTLSS
jgi:hypothetical protein